MVEALLVDVRLKLLLSCGLVSNVWVSLLSNLLFLVVVGVRLVLPSLPVYFFISVSFSRFRSSFLFSSVLLEQRKPSHNTSELMCLWSCATKFILKISFDISDLMCLSSVALTIR